MLNISKLVLLFALVLTQCKSKNTTATYTSETLKIIQLSDHSFVHVSYLQTDSFGKVACNGYIYMNEGEAIVFDTPSDIVTTRELLAWLESTKHVQIKGLVVNHFHIDALGGIEEFHKKSIPTYSHKKTAALVTPEKNKPQHTFNKELILKVGDKEAVNRYFGEAHTTDNIASYIPEEKLVYGGCMVKSLNAAKGNLEDANIQEWSSTIQKIKDAYPDLKTVVPGHGPHGGTELLDYTKKLFKTN